VISSTSFRQSYLMTAPAWPAGSAVLRPLDGSATSAPIRQRPPGCAGELREPRRRPPQSHLAVGSTGPSPASTPALSARVGLPGRSPGHVIFAAPPLMVCNRLDRKATGDAVDSRPWPPRRDLIGLVAFSRLLTLAAISSIDEEGSSRRGSLLGAPATSCRSIADNFLAAGRYDCAKQSSLPRRSTAFSRPWAGSQREAESYPVDAASHRREMPLAMVSASTAGRIEVERHGVSEVTIADLVIAGHADVGEIAPAQPESAKAERAGQNRG